MSDIIFYNSYDIFNNPNNLDRLKKIPGGTNFSSYFKIFSQNITAVDRTGAITMPLKCKVLPHLMMPEMVKFDKSFAEIMDDRAKELMQQAITGNRKIAVMYSGGVDSTALLVSFFRNFDPDVVRKQIVVLLSDHSIRENPTFFYNHIIKKVDCVSVYRFPYFLGNDKFLFMSGENADQLFGSQVVSTFTNDKPFDCIFRDVESMSGEIIDWFGLRLKRDKPYYEQLPKNYEEHIFELFNKSVKAAPIQIDNVYKFFWWINFTTKWQSVYTRILTYSQNKDTLRPEENYTTFYGTKDFQLWSLNNTDSFIKGTPNSAKYVAKDYIFDYNRDSDYLNKPKIGSLSFIVRQKNMSMMIDEDINFIETFPSEEYYNYENDFL
jgi:hypothetical protein